MKVSKYFSKHELACKCCGKLPTENGVITEEAYNAFLTKLDDHRDAIGFPYTPNSAYRCYQHNQDVGGEMDSKHLKGVAVDIPCNGEKAAKVIEAAIRLGWKGIGVYQSGGMGSRFVHIDYGRDQFAMWSK